MHIRLLVLSTGSELPAEVKVPSLKEWHTKHVNLRWYVGAEVMLMEHALQCLSWGTGDTSFHYLKSVVSDVVAVVGTKEPSYPDNGGKFPA